MDRIPRVLQLRSRLTFLELLLQDAKPILPLLEPCALLANDVRTRPLGKARLCEKIMGSFQKVARLVELTFETISLGRGIAFQNEANLDTANHRGRAFAATDRHITAG